MLGGRVIGEGVDGCVLANSMWPCQSGSHGVPEPTNTRYVSKIVSINDEESENLKVAARLLGPNLASKYLAGLEGECKPANAINPPSSRDMLILKKSIDDLKNKSKSGQACDTIAKKVEKRIALSKDSKVMFISKYDSTVSDWFRDEHVSYNTASHKVEKAIPKFIEVLQLLYQNDEEQLVHIDLHTGNIFIRNTPFEFGIADFGRCVFRRHGVDPSTSFYGKFLLEYITRYQMYCQYSQTPLEVRILNYCFKKNLDNVRPDELVQKWESDLEVKTNENGFSDFISFERYHLVKHLLTKILFVSMLESIQSISRKIRLNMNNPSGLYKNLSDKERIVVEFMLTRYSIIAPINTITQELVIKYGKEKMVNSRLFSFLKKSMLMPYDQDGSSLVNALTVTQDADMRLVWST
jgi:hypothetical protein